MIDRAQLNVAVDTAWTISRVRHPVVDDRDARRCLLEHHLYGKSEARVGYAEELAGFGIAYLERLPDDA